MNIGLLSMQRVNNYGSFWQAYCLKNMLAENGNAVEFIDIIPGEVGTRTESKKSFSLKKIIRIPYYMRQKKKGEIFKKVQAEVLKCTFTPNYSENYNTIIIGSDEVFNCVQKSPWGFSTQLYGDINNSNVSSYAACFGYTTLEDINERGIRDSIKRSLEQLRYISVRDKNSFEIIKNITGRCPEIHLDPVIVGDLPVDKLPSIKEKNKYILIYSYDFRFSDRSIINQIRKIAKQKDCKIYSVGFYQDWCDKNIVTDPLTLLAYFKNAEYIVTDTFHGTIFSARCHKQFATVIRSTNRQKLEDLLIRIHLKDRIFTEEQDLLKVLDAIIDYDEFENLRKNERVRTEKYLNGCLNLSQ